MKLRIAKGIKVKKITFSQAEKMADKALSKLVRTEKPICEFHTNKYFGWNLKGPYCVTDWTVKPPCHCSGPLQLCHKISRSKKATRYDRKNVFSGCSGSNAWAHYNQVKWDALWKKMWPEDVEELTLKSRMVCKRSTEDLIQMAIYFDAERKKFGD